MNITIESATEEITLKRAARKACLGQSVYASRGRTDKRTYVTMSTPVEIMDGDATPKVVGLPYWKTGFNNGRGFSLTLYTPSTMRIVVGRNWQK